MLSKEKKKRGSSSEKKCLNCDSTFRGRGLFFCSGSCRAKKGWRDGTFKGLTGKTGEKNPNWKGGKTIRNGYVFRKVGAKKYIGEHRLIMGEFLGRKLSVNEEVHHRNGIKDDNRISNLELVIKSFHFGKVGCPKCNFNFLVK